MHRSILLVATGGILVFIAVSLIALSQPPEIGDKPIVLTEEQAVQTGRDFLESKQSNAPAGSVLLAEVEEKPPNFYWDEVFELEKPNVQEPTLCWIVRFEQAARPGHFFEVWVGAYSGDVLGGTQCR